MADIRTGLAANLAPIPGLQESPWLLSNPTPPAAEIQPDEVDYDQALGRGLDRWRFTVRVFAGFTSDVGAQKLLDLMLAPSGPRSVKAALESDCTLGGKVDDLRVTRCSGYRLYGRDGGPSVLGAEWQVEVLVAGR
ncbi:MAG: hypothetical protein IRZ28_11190 [Steroidobacteraceae bacterium]|nr:hypothetical protein [Steroidobacteraceae bacterium]